MASCLKSLPAGRAGDFFGPRRFVLRTEPLSAGLSVHLFALETMLRRKSLIATQICVALLCLALAATSAYVGDNVNWSRRQLAAWVGLFAFFTPIFFLIL